MNRFFRLMVLTSAISAPLGLLTAQAADPLESAVPPAPAASNSAEPVAHRLVGVAGCNAVSCHGGQSLAGGEGKDWLARDTNHRRAYDVLFNEVARNMATRLNLKHGAHNEARCLACHSSAKEAVANSDDRWNCDAHPTSNDRRKCDEAGRPIGSPARAANTIQGERFAIEFGVGCESCHGAASGWIAEHTTRTWKSRSTEYKTKLGFRDLTPLAARTETCVACHIGSPAATVDHDLIAAGHPRLAFEMSAFHALLPKHWDAAAERQQDPGQEVRLWAIGQAASAKAMSDIVGDRARKAGASPLTPDFAEFDCNACHHDLWEKSYGNPTLSSPLGTPRWGSWTVRSAKFAVHKTASEESLKSLLAVMDRSRLGTAPANDVVAAAKQSSADLATWIGTMDATKYDAAQTTALLHRLVDVESDAIWEKNKDGQIRWDGQMQRYLAIAAASRSLQGLTGKSPFPPSSGSRALIPLRTHLNYRPSYATPSGYDPQQVDPIAELRKSMTR
ncbi:MAG: hypothetical protein ACKV2Q_16620 [Planctomycetaceae bacterium]